ncbi:MAG: thioredoxin domain-containing protein [Bacteroidia bacterium]|nr:thioredoxin domain-containing protein [Bacteroidia bacterium]
MNSKNGLQFESSLYLQQHAGNPVHWQPWHASAFADAQSQNKLVLISIGYAACHWCHVMEHESFTNPEIAQVMNTHFICIKVDREEYPDVDQVYMQAVQLMTGRGGWPLNILALPDGRPLYGGTYFTPQQWLEALQAVSNFYHNKSNTCMQYADELESGMAQMVQFTKTITTNWKDTLNAAFEKMQGSFDAVDGGFNRSPKFPMPGLYLFLMEYGNHSQIEKAKQHALLTLRKMALGGINDQLSGGFARYATDTKWKVPHFEKMLYDNAQLISAYCLAYKNNPDALFEKTITETIAFLNGYMLSEGGYGAAIDADSEGVEGKYYTWTQDELQHILGLDFNLFAAYYQVNEGGYWEHNHYILCCKQTLKKAALELNLSYNEFETRINNLRKRVLEARAKRIAPAFDDKKITAWNALTITAFVDAHFTIGNFDYLQSALQTAEFICDKLWIENNLYHTFKNNKATINGCLDDYTFTAQAFIKLYQATGNSQWLLKAHRLIETTLHQFASQNALCYYNHKNANLFNRPLQINDDVIASGNSILAQCLFQLGQYFGNNGWLDAATQMVQEVVSEIEKYPAGYAYWLQLIQWMQAPYYQICFAGPDAVKLHQAFFKLYNFSYLPILVTKPETHPWSLNKFQNDNVIYICKHGQCFAPLSTIQEALSFLQNNNSL